MDDMGGITVSWIKKNGQYSKGHYHQKDMVKFHIRDDDKRYRMRLEGLMKYWKAKHSLGEDTRRVLRMSYKNFQPSTTSQDTNVIWKNEKGDTLTLKFTDADADANLNEEESQK